ncbi:hypothetical protein [Fluviispira vulneris]|uniref:hypothetical protein n=1 Tax=Fluviispira vulneris TaxID=2763012 RepID=UPI001645B89D|nr:hypothetical protein [Fluviispira vulneris]
MLPQTLQNIYHAHQILIIKFAFGSFITIIFYALFFFKGTLKRIKILLLFANFYLIFVYLIYQKNELYFIKYSLFLFCLWLFQYSLSWLKQNIEFFLLNIKSIFSWNKNKEKYSQTSMTPTQQALLNTSSSTLPLPQTKLNSSFGSPQILTSFGLKVRSKSEVFIAEKLFEHKIDFRYEIPLSAEGKTYFPDFTIYIGKKVFYWEHFGMLSNEDYLQKTKNKIIWYDKNFPKKLIMTEECNDLLPVICVEINKLKRIKQRWQPLHLLQTLKSSRGSKEYASRTRPI